MTPGGTLRQRILKAGGWTMVGYAAGQVIRLSSSLVMTRLLVPEMFGVMAIATMVMVILNMMSDLGVHQNIVQSRRGEDPVFLDTAWTLQIARGVVLWAIALLLSAALYGANRLGLVPPASVYADPVLPAVVAVSTFSAVISGLQAASIPLALRNFDQRRLVAIDLLGQASGLAFMIVVGYATRSIWALVGGGLVTSAVIALLSHTWLPGHRNRLSWDRGALHELVHFGKWTFVSSIFSVLATHGDRLLLGGLVEPEVLGVYAIAVLILGAVDGALGRLFTSVSFPALSEVARSGDHARLRSLYYKLRLPGDVVLLLSGGVLFMVGSYIIRVLYDARYQGAGTMLEILALSFIAQRYNVSYHIYLAVGKPLYLAIINVSRCVSLFILVPVLFAWGGTTAAIWGIALHGLAMVPFVHGFNARMGLNDTRREILVLAALPLGLALGYAAQRMLALW